MTALAKLPAVTVAISFKTDQGAVNGSFTGPLLWTVLLAAPAVTGKPDPARQVAKVTGADGYSAVLALGEIAPTLEDKQVVLALAMNGKPLGARHLRLVVPGDRYGPRSVRDVVRIAITSPG